MNTRHIAAGLLAAAALAASAGSADATPMSQPMPEPGRGTTEVQAASAVRDSLMKELLAEYSTSHRRSVHNEIVLFRNLPASAVL
jgi:hypothetical protein